MAKKTVETMINDMANAAAELARETFLESTRRLSANISSPIEKLLLATLLAERENYFDDSPRFLGLYFTGGKYVWPEPPPLESTFCYTQAAIGPYKADFLFVVHSDTATKFIVVECDGHDFHERTKEQAAHDRSRDRWMVENGVTVLRFTGSELWKDPIAAVDQIYGIVTATVWSVNGG